MKKLLVLLTLATVGCDQPTVVQQQAYWEPTQTMVQQCQVNPALSVCSTNKIDGMGWYQYYLLHQMLSTNNGVTRIERHYYYVPRPTAPSSPVYTPAPNTSASSSSSWSTPSYRATPSRPPTSSSSSSYRSFSGNSGSYRSFSSPSRSSGSYRSFGSRPR